MIVELDVVTKLCIAWILTEPPLANAVTVDVIVAVFVLGATTIFIAACALPPTTPAATLIYVVVPSAAAALAELIVDVRLEVILEAVICTTFVFAAGLVTVALAIAAVAEAAA